jgi:hypothetical protein
MGTAALPKIERTAIPRFARITLAIVFHALVRPANWLVTALGREPLIVSIMNRAQQRGGLARTFADYEPTEHDVFVSTFAKSGTNWMMQIAHQIAFRGAGDYEHIHDVVCWPDMKRRGKRQISIPLSDTMVQQASPTGLRVIKTHLSAHDVPYREQAHYLAVIRDPKELFVSSYFFAAGAAGPLMPTRDEWFELFLTDRFPFNFGHTWAEHTASYWALRDKPNVLVLLFQDMKRNLPGAVRAVADTLGVQLSDDELQAVIDRSTFSYMSGIEDKFTPMPKGTLPWGEGLKMMRQGKSGNSTELLSREQQQRIDTHFQAELVRLGSDFPYEQLFGRAETRSDRDTRTDAPSSPASIRNTA